MIRQAGGEIERYPDVHEWLGSVNAYLLEDIERMEAGERPSPTGGLRNNPLATSASVGLTA